MKLSTIKNAKPLERLKLSQHISEIEDRNPKMLANLTKYFHAESLKRSLCFTGPAGVGKSSLITRLIHEMSQELSGQQRLAWLACDPSSPQSEGSILGDRIRMAGSMPPENLFIRSLSTRSSSAFSKAIRDIEIYLENFFDEVWVETAGSGQTQFEVARISGLTVLVLQPETGDDVQWMKSGVREWADLFIIHKSDLPGAEAMAEGLLQQGARKEQIILVSSKNKTGLKDVLQALERQRRATSWTARLKVLHQAHAKELFLERMLKELDRQFKKEEVGLLKNPYRVHR